VYNKDLDNLGLYFYKDVMKLKTVTILFILAEVFDIITTFVGLELGLIEINPLFMFPQVLLFFKLLVTVFISFCLESLPNKRIYYTLPIVAWLPVFWNSLNIVLVLL
jgi:hypothetical protein